MDAKAKIPVEAMVAIEDAVREGHSVFCLEQLGVSQRVINLLYDNGVRSVADLVNKSPRQLLAIPNFGDSNLKSVVGALSRYNTIEDI